MVKYSSSSLIVNISTTLVLLTVAVFTPFQFNYDGWPLWAFIFYGFILVLITIAMLLFIWLSNREE